MKSVAVIIPIFQPGPQFLSIITELKDLHVKVLIINDGSTEHVQRLTESSSFPFVHVIHHEANLGKGAAIKTGVHHIKVTNPEIKYIFTMDGDGQHLVSDLKRLLESCQNTNFDILLGVRNFSISYVPLRSWVGNRISNLLFKIFCGTHLSDSQCGLRGYKKSTFNHLLQCSCDRYDFETEVLARLLRSDFTFVEIEIQTVYIDKNRASHFLPFVDSFKIFRALLK